MLQKRGLDSEAAEAYSRCIEANENFSRAYVNLGLILEKRGDTNRALQTWAWSDYPCTQDSGERTRVPVCGAESHRPGAGNA
jgi:hypothetical protein